MIDGELLAVVQAMALGMLCEDCEDGYSCPHCSAEAGFSGLRKDVPEIDEIEHDADCPVNVARLLLFKNGTPMGIYKITGEYRSIERKREKWHAASGHELAISAPEAIRCWSSRDMRNVEATFVRPFPEYS